MLTITGSGFGCTPGYVFFPNANNGGTSNMHSQLPDVQSWQDDQIMIWVPGVQDATTFGVPGSGQITVVTADGDTSDLSTDALTIDYAVRNIRNPTTFKPYPVALKIQDTLGGYTFRPSSAITGDTLAAITKAMNDWKCQIGIRYTMGPSIAAASAQQNPNDGINTILFASISDTNVLCRTFPAVEYPEPCRLNISDTVGTISDIDMVFNTNRGVTTFDLDLSNTDNVPNYQASILGVGRHEFGHSFGLNHVLEHTVMYFKDPGAGYPPAQIESGDQNGGIYQLTDVGPTYLNVSCYSSQNFPSGCPTLPIENGIINIADNPLNILVYPNPFNESITIKADVEGAENLTVKVFDILGQMVLAHDYGIISGAIQESIDVHSLTTGMYIVMVSVNMQSKQFKMIKK